MSTMEYGYFSIQRHDMTSRSVLSRGQHSFWRRMDDCHIFTASMGMSFLCYLVTSRDDVSASRKYSSIEAMHAVKPLLMNIEKVSLPGCQECNYRFSVIKDCVSFLAFSCQNSAEMSSTLCAGDKGLTRAPSVPYISVPNSSMRLNWFQRRH
jgi:hypothetical protein